MPQSGEYMLKKYGYMLVFWGDGLFLRVPKRRRHASRAEMLEKSGITFFLRVPKRRRHANRAKMLEISKLGF